MKDRRAFREQVAALAQRRDFQALTDLAGRQSGVPALLLQWLYNPEDLLQWRAIEALGHVAQAHPAQVQKVIGRLLWLLNEDSGSFGWGAAAALGEIAARQLPLMQDIISMFCGFLEAEFSRASMLWGVNRVAEIHPETLAEVIPFVAPLLQDAEPQVRGLAARALGLVRDKAAAAALNDLLTDAAGVRFYHQGDFRETTVADLAREALARLAGPTTGATPEHLTVRAMPGRTQ